MLTTAIRQVNKHLYSGAGKYMSEDYGYRRIHAAE